MVMILLFGAIMPWFFQPQNLSFVLCTDGSRTNHFFCQPFSTCMSTLSRGNAGIVISQFFLDASFAVVFALWWMSIAPFDDTHNILSVGS